MFRTMRAGEQAVAARQELPLIKCMVGSFMVGDFVDKRNLSDIAHNLFDHMIELKGSRNSLAPVRASRQ